MLYILPHAGSEKVKLCKLMVKRFGEERGKRMTAEVNGFISPCFCGTWKCILGRNISSFHHRNFSPRQWKVNGKLFAWSIILRGFSTLSLPFSPALRNPLFFPGFSEFFTLLFLQSFKDNCRTNIPNQTAMNRQSKTSCLFAGKSTRNGVNSPRSIY